MELFFGLPSARGRWRDAAGDDKNEKAVGADLTENPIKLRVPRVWFERVIGIGATRQSDQAACALALILARDLSFAAIHRS